MEIYIIRVSVALQTLDDRNEEIYKLEGKLEALNLENEKLHDECLDLKKAIGDLESDHSNAVDEKDNAHYELKNHSRKVLNIKTLFKRFRLGNTF